MSTGVPFIGPGLSAFERGRRRPSLASLDRILAALDAHLTHLALACRRVEGSRAGRTSLALVALVAVASPVAAQELSAAVIDSTSCPNSTTCFEVVGEVVERRTVWLDSARRRHVERLRLAGIEAPLYCPPIGPPPGSAGGACRGVEVGQRYRAIGVVVLSDEGAEVYRVAGIEPSPPGC